MTFLTRPLRSRLGRIADYARRYLTVGMVGRFDATDRRFEKLERRIDRLASDEVAQLASDVARLTAALEAAIRSQAALPDQLSAAIDRSQEAMTAALTLKVDQSTGLLGAKSDEILIKTRPLLDYDEQSWAIRIRDGYVMLAKSETDLRIMLTNATSDGLEPGVAQVIRRLLGPGMTAVDVGANIGLLTVPAAMRVGPTGQVLAFEPDPGPRAQLAKTLRFNGLNWVTLTDQAVGARAGRQDFHVSAIIGHSSLHALPDSEVATEQLLSVEVVTLDDVIAPGAGIDLVKIDVEGAELEVLDGMTRVLVESPDLAIIAEFGPSHLERAGISPDDWFRAFDEKGFSPYLIEEPTGLVRPTRADALRDCFSENILFLHPRSRPWRLLGLALAGTGAGPGGVRAG